MEEIGAAALACFLMGFFVFIGLMFGGLETPSAHQARELICIQAGCQPKDCEEWVQNADKTDRLFDYCIKKEGRDE